MEWRLRGVVPAAAVTTHAKPHAQQQLPRDLEVERAAMGQRCRPQSFDEVQRGNPQQRRLVTFLAIFCSVLERLEFTPAASATPPQPIVLSIHSLFIRSCTIPQLNEK